MKIAKHFDKLGFHDASVVNIERHEDSITLVIKGMRIYKEHPDSSDCDWELENAKLTILGVTEERTTFWDDNKAAKEHPEPEFPLDEIMHAGFSNGVFSFDGLKQREPWYEWFITASSFVLEAYQLNKIS